MKFPAGRAVFLRTEERRTEFCLERPDNTDVVCAASNCKPEKPSISVWDEEGRQYRLFISDEGLKALQRYSKSI